MPLRQDDYRLREFDADELAKSWGFTIPRSRRKVHQIERETVEQNQQDAPLLAEAKERRELVEKLRQRL
jgi:tRNA(Glu) U13 pseudouridine synthase TruD